MPSRPEGRFSNEEGLLERWEEEEGKMVERVPRGVRWRIRRASMADS
jgi:hypothetical protein